jgi:hypothetical protein
VAIEWKTRGDLMLELLAGIENKLTQIALKSIRDLLKMLLYLEFQCSTKMFDFRLLHKNLQYMN